ncbi:penicillin-binding protein activator [Solemya pervernicosa gill symbiont]|uniref:penicillin-binding protein activator n=1 Tax=Solemya pervernicosa gill symbiont TaxID=642797 RepID=UPI00155F9F18|nr:penicillin-binding protein activator [Solemya pervernicosa gill symbiont]
MNNLQVKRHHLTRLGILTLTALLIGCSTTSRYLGYGDSPSRTPVQVEDRSKTLDGAQQWLVLSARSPTPLRQEYQLNAAELLLRANNHDDAKTLLSIIDTSSVDYSLQLRKSLLQGEIAIFEMDARSALRWLQPPEDYPIADELRPQLHSLRGQAFYLSSRWQQSAAERVALEPLLLDPLDVNDNHQIIWLTLSLLSDEALSAAADELPSMLNGWMELLAISRAYRFQASQMESALANWQARYPTHPGMQQRIPDMLAQAREVSRLDGPLALLLPLSGKHAAAGHAIRDGFLAAHYAGKDEGRNGEVRIYDTIGGAEQAYNAALRDGAQLVIGPLRKQAVTDIASIGSLQVPVLALNHALSDTPRNLYQFGLSPEDEIVQIADQALMDGYSSAIALVPNGAWGDRLLQTLQNRWEQFGGEMLEVQRYTSSGSDFSAPIRALLDTDASQSRKRALTRIIGGKVKFEPRRRQDADIIFMLAFPRQARLIRPQLKFHYLGKIPIYATSHVYTGHPDKAKDRDMDGILFCDMPWTLGKSQQHNPLRQQLQTLWPKQMKRSARLYALGIDAYNLAPALNVLANRPGTRVEGESGTLYLDEQHNIRRILRWASFVRGEPRPLVQAAAGVKTPSGAQADEQ